MSREKRQGEIRLKYSRSSHPDLLSLLLTIFNMKTIEQKLKGEFVGKGKVIKFKPQKDENGLYYGFCLFEHHRGLITNNSYCRKLNCKHYLKVYLK